MISKILTVMQPSAYLIIHGYQSRPHRLHKDVENRTWSTKHRGRLYIHAGKSWDSRAHLGLRELGQLPASADVTRHFTLDMGDVTRRHANQFGAIIGYVDLVDVVRDSSSSWAEPELYHWVLANPVAINPIQVRGQLGIWEHEL